LIYLVFGFFAGGGMLKFSTDQFIEFFKDVPSDASFWKCGLVGAFLWPCAIPIFFVSLYFWFMLSGLE